MAEGPARRRTSRRCGPGPRLPGQGAGHDRAPRWTTILPPDAAELDKVKGYSGGRPEVHWPATPTSASWQAPVTKDKLKWYIGKKGIGRLGCYGCHDVPGFETAKPVGTALNDWGKKDPERLAFEDADAYVREHYNIVEARNAAGDPHQAGPGLALARTASRPTRSCSTTRWSTTRARASCTRSWRSRAATTTTASAPGTTGCVCRSSASPASRRQAGETDEAYQVRQEQEEAEAREAVMTFILGLVAEPIPLKFVNSPSPDRLAEAKGRQGAGQVQLRRLPSGAAGRLRVQADARRRSTPWSTSTRRYETNDAKKDHVFPGHNAWTGVGSPLAGSPRRPTARRPTSRTTRTPIAIC